jgi:antirestriction protein ArdC
MISGFEAPIWMTYKQAQTLDSSVKKVEQGASVFTTTYTKSLWPCQNAVFDRVPLTPEALP